MSFFRPEAQAALVRWREVICGALLVCLGMWLVLGPGFLLAVPGFAAVVGGAVLVWIGVQRGRFRGAGGGVGAVMVDEGQVTYYGPLSGGSVAMRELDRLSLERGMFPAHWRLEQSGQAPVLIPVNAEGSEALFDAFAILPGLQTERMLSALKAEAGQAIVIWQKDAARPAGITVH